MSQTDNIKTYFEQRIEKLGVTTANNFIEWQPLAANGEPLEQHNKTPRFETDAHHNIIINYYRLDGRPYTYKPENLKSSKNYTRTRLQFPKKKKDGKEAKYESPYGSPNFPYFPKEIIEAYKNGEVIETLVITEGEFKAEMACRVGVWCMAVSGIHNWYDADGRKQLHQDICELIVACKIKRVLFLTDADTLMIKYAPDKELSERPVMFYSAIKNFREAMMQFMALDNTIELRDVYYGHLKIEMNKRNQKGLDDLLQDLTAKHESIRKSLMALEPVNDWFDIFNISDGLNKISQHFGLASAENFYITYEEFLLEKEFTYKKLRYRWDTEEKKLFRIKHTDTQLYMRIGADWFKRVFVPNKYGEQEEEVKKWKVSEITRDYSKKYPTFLDDVPKFDAWCNIPAMDGNYQRVVDGCFNLFNPLSHIPAEGSFPTTAKFLKHLFEGDAFLDEVGKEHGIIGDPFTVALDYLTLMFRNPTQILPVLCLVSPENGTGKSTFLKWLKDIYGSNATIIDNERFKQSFNGHYITKYIIGIDEGFLDVDKRSEKERLKKLATDERQYLEFKGADVQEIDFYGKIIICSNDADSLMKIEEGEIRWFVVRVKTFASRGEKEDPDFRAKMKAEIPAFLHFLKNRALVHPKEGRAWFAPEHIVTEQLKIIIDKTRNRVERVVDDLIKDWFMTYKLNSIYIDAMTLCDIINKDGYSKYKIDRQEILNYLGDKRKMKLTEPKQLKYPGGFDSNSGEVIIRKEKVGRCFEFLAQDWAPDALQVSELGMSAILGENGKTAAQPFENALPFKDDF
jgi:hypothetical protein